MKIFEYSNYQEYLRDAIKKRKAENRNFSYRYMALTLKLKSPTFFNWVVQGKKKLSVSLAHRVADLFKLNPKEKAYFMLLVNYSNANTEADKSIYLEKIITTRLKNLNTLDPTQYAYYQHWHHSVIREILEEIPFSGDYRDLASRVRPKITAKQAEHSIEVLKNLKLIKKSAKGDYSNTGQGVLTTGENWDSLVIENMQKKMMDLGKEAVSTIDRKERDVSNVFAGLSRENFQKVRDKIKELRRYILSLSQNDKDVEEIYLCNVQLFPVTRGLKEPEE